MPRCRSYTHASNVSVILGRLCASIFQGLLQCIRDQKVPADLVDVLNEAGVQYFEGACFNVPRRPAGINTRG